MSQNVSVGLLSAAVRGRETIPKDRRSWQAGGVVTLLYAVVLEARTNYSPEDAIGFCLRHPNGRSAEDPSRVGVR